MNDATPSHPGWYEDPQEPDQLRYFDGILWTSHVTPVSTRTAPQAQTPEPAAPRAAASSGSSTATRGDTSAPPGNPYAAPTPYPPRLPWPVPAGPTATDGTPLASLGLRVVAYLLDSLIVNILALVLGGWFLYQAIEPMLPALTRALETNDAEAFNAAFGLIDTLALTMYTVVKLLVVLAYGVFFLTRWSATPSMRLVGISVRRTAAAGTIGWDTASRRVGFVVVLDAVSNLPVVGIVGLVLVVLNLLWPFRDARRQALHDKVADTIVVKGRQPRHRQAPA